MDYFASIPKCSFFFCNLKRSFENFYLDNLPINGIKTRRILFSVIAKCNVAGIELAQELLMKR